MAVTVKRGGTDNGGWWLMKWKRGFKLRDSPPTDFEGHNGLDSNHIKKVHISDPYKAQKSPLGNML
jgi:hypothetical protein